MYQKFKDLFTKNLPWKAFSILVSALLWFIVMNINNPTEIKAFSIPLNISDLSEFDEKNISILNMDELKEVKVEIKLKATRPVLDELKKKFSNTDIKAYLDTAFLANLSEITSPLEISSQIKTNLSSIPYPNNNFEILSFSPSSVNLNIDTFVTVPKKIYVNEIGTVKNGYIAYTPEISSEYIQISGAKSIIDSVDSVYVDIDISNKSDTFSESVTPIAYDQ
ncbi:MAG: hypothetical protein K2L15_03200, partial [Eubacteriales bacterium]|nr:hypothetical protein [Eubacteriales bacterium]